MEQTDIFVCLGITQIFFGLLTVILAIVTVVAFLNVYWEYASGSGRSLNSWDRDDWLLLFKTTRRQSFKRYQLGLQYLLYGYLAFRFTCRSYCARVSERLN